MLPRALSLSLLLFCASFACAASPDALFRDGVEAYHSGEFARAARAFRESVAQQPGSGALQNLGNAEWQRRRTGAAILAWERARWLDPFNENAKGNLRFARATAQLEAPELRWYEVASTWLPANWWAWIAGASLWFAVSMVMLPGILRWRKAGWHQALAAVGFAVFLLCAPALAGVHTRSRVGIVLQKDTPLRLTPTQAAQEVTRLAGGEPARWVRSRGNYLFIRTSRMAGWVDREELGLVCPR